MRIRKFQASDAPEVARLHRNTIRNINSKDYTKEQIMVWSGRTTSSRFKESIDKFHRFVVLDNGKIIGFGDFSNDGELSGVYVHHKYIGKGIGKTLVEKMENAALNMGIKKFHLISTITALDFYKHLGYRVIRKSTHRIKNKKLPVYKMRKKLTREQLEKSI